MISPVRFEEKIFVGVPVRTMNTNFNTVPQFYFNLILHVISVLYLDLTTPTGLFAK